MARDKNQPQQIVAHIIIESRYKIWHGHLFLFHLAPQLFVLPLQPRLATEMINRPMLRRRHQPSARIIRHARLRPLLQRSNQCVLRQILRNAHVAHHPRKPGNNPRRFDPPNRVNRAMYFGSAHSQRSHHVRSCRRKQAERAEPPTESEPNRAAPRIHDLRNTAQIVIPQAPFAGGICFFLNICAKSRSLAPFGMTPRHFFRKPFSR